MSAPEEKKRDPWELDVAKVTVLLAPQGTELPPGFPFVRHTADLKQSLAIIGEMEPADAPVVLCVPESAAETLIGLRGQLDFNALSLVGTDTDPIGMWQLIVAPLREIAVAEVMASRDAEPTFERQLSQGESVQLSDVKTFDRDLSVLKQRTASWDSESDPATPEDA